VHAVEIVLGMVALAAVVATVADRLRAPAPALLVLAGLLVGLLPGVPPIEVSPDVVSLVVLPPLIYAAATELALPELRKVLRPVLVLAVGLVALTAFAVAGVVWALVHPRGGGELGRRWYLDGKLLHKRNTFTDFIAVTEYLVASKIGAADQVYALGGSAGGLLMGAIVNMRPELYRGVIALVPFVDVVTTMLDESIPLTTNEFDEWGNPKDKAAYDYMLGYSPYDNIKPQAYPSIYVRTGLWDSQVQYFEPAKWVAKLRATKTDDNVIVLDTDMSAGHGGKSGRFDRLHDTARYTTFLLQTHDRPDRRARRN